MKITKLLAGSLAAVALGVGFTACSDDAPDSGKNNVVDRDQVRYLSIALNNPGAQGSRALDENFEDGSSAESQINTLVFVFYDGQGNPTAQMKTFNASEGTVNNVFNDENVTRFWEKVVPVEMTQGQNLPAYVMCFVNPINYEGLATMTLPEVETITRTRIKNNNLFAMSNSVYYGNDPISGKQNVRMMATPILDSKLYRNPDDAAADDASILDIYVERYAAKIGLSLAPGSIENYDVNVITDAEGASTAGAIKFTPAFWRPNAIDEHTFVTKAFSTGQGTLDPTKPADFSAMEALFNSKTGMFQSWNSPTYFRSYWACSPSYYAGAYPNVSDNITDNDNWETEFPYALRYFTYEQIEKGIDAANLPPSDPGIAWNIATGFTTVAGDANNAASGYFYSRETTAQIANITSTTFNNKAVVASAVIVGNYALTTATNPTTFYLYGMANGKPNFYGDHDLLLEVMVKNQKVIFSDQNGTKLVDNEDIFNIEHPSKDVRGNENVAGRLVTLQINLDKLKASTTNAAYFYDGTDFVAIDETNLADANSLLWKTVSTAQMFKNGLAFFSIPIRHLGFGQNVDGNAPLISDDDNQAFGASSNVYQWQNMRPGDFGIVRNHVYNLNVTRISGLGTGLRDEQQPIVPPMDPDNYYVKAKLNVLSWRVVPTQSVIL